MRTIIVKLYQYDELEESAKEKARDWFAQGLFDYDWWDSTYQDAENIGLKITSFDCNRHQIEGRIQKSVNEVVRSIRKEHGKACGIYKLAMAIDLRKANDRGEDMETFEQALLKEYLSMLNAEVEYMQSTEYIEEGIRANEYEFTEDGKRG